MTGEPLLKIEDATRDYAVRAAGRPATLRALGGIDLVVAAGEVTAIVGESGCGKTTLSRLCLGIEQPSSGSILLAGRPVGAYGRLDRARLVQPIFQDPYSSLNPRQTLGAIIAAPLAVRGEGSARSRRAEVLAMMDAVGLSGHLAMAYPSQISGGQRQRAAIARALIGRPRLIICDEPTSALDVSVQSQIINLLGRMRRQFDLTILLISHNLAVVHHLADRVAVMYLGRIVESGPTETLFARPRHPYTRLLIDAILPPMPGERPRPAAPGAEAPNPIEPPTGCPFHPRCPAATGLCRTVLPEVTGDAAAFFRCHHPLG